MTSQGSSSTSVVNAGASNQGSFPADTESNYMLGSSNKSLKSIHSDVEKSINVEQNMSEEIKNVNLDKQKQMENFLLTANNEYTPEEMKRFLKEGIMADGLRMLKVEDCDWYYDYYQTTKTSNPPVKELKNATVDYYHYTTPFETQLGNINLVMMHSQLNFADNTFAPADRFFKLNAPTQEMIKRAKIQAAKYKNM